MNGKIPTMITKCTSKKCGEYNILSCCREKGHSGDCIYVVDESKDYPKIIGVKHD